MTQFVSLQTHDIRFPTSRHLDGSDAMNPAPDYSAAYVVIATDAATAHGARLRLHLGRGNDVQTEAIRALSGWIVGRDVEQTLATLGDLGRELTGDPQLAGSALRRASFTWRWGRHQRVWDSGPNAKASHCGRSCLLSRRRRSSTWSTFGTCPTR